MEFMHKINSGLGGFGCAAIRSGGLRPPQQPITPIMMLLNNYRLPLYRLGAAEARDLPQNPQNSQNLLLGKNLPRNPQNSL